MYRVEGVPGDFIFVKQTEEHVNSPAPPMTDSTTDQPSRAQRVKNWWKDFSLKQQLIGWFWEAVYAADYRKLRKLWWLWVAVTVLVQGLILGFIIWKEMTVETLLFGASATAYMRMGGLNGQSVLHACKGKGLWRLIAFIPQNATLVQFVLNVYTLLTSCVTLFPHVFYVEIIVIFTISGSNAGLFSSLLEGDECRVGASAAMSGLLGCTISLIVTLWYELDSRGTAAKSPCLSIVIQIAMSFLPGNSIILGMGGVSTGFALGLFFLNFPLWRNHAFTYTKYNLNLWCSSVILINIGILVDGVVLYGTGCS